MENHAAWFYAEPCRAENHVQADKKKEKELPRQKNKHPDRAR